MGICGSKSLFRRIVLRPVKSGIWRDGPANILNTAEGQTMLSVNGTLFFNYSGLNSSNLLFCPPTRKKFPLIIKLVNIDFNIKIEMIREMEGEAQPMKWPVTIWPKSARIHDITRYLRKQIGIRKDSFYVIKFLSEQQISLGADSASFSK
jgi:hypothetical protein